MPGGLSEPARRFWRRLTGVKRTAFDASRLTDAAREAADAVRIAAVDAQARIAAGRLRAGVQAPSLAEWIRRSVQAPDDFPAVVLELQACGRVVLQYPDPPGVDMARGCPKCGASIRWLVMRGGLEQPWCSACGALDFWLVVELEPRRTVGFGCSRGGSLW